MTQKKSKNTKKKDVKKTKTPRTQTKTSLENLATQMIKVMTLGLNGGKEKKKKETKKKPMHKETNPQSRRWCFTLYPDKLTQEFFTVEKPGETPEEAWIIKNLNIPELDSHLWLEESCMRGICYSLESGDSKQHVHVQGYAEFSLPVRFKRLQQLWGYGVHLEVANGNREENLDYIRHQGEHEKKGTLHHISMMGSFPGSSGDEKGCYDEAVSMILEGIPIKTIMEAYKGKLLPQVNNLIRLQNAIETPCFGKLRAIKEKEIALREMRFYNPTDVPF